jgi:NADPH:quinone reductase-like Zn-dependent oxidoreductase
MKAIVFRRYGSPDVLEMREVEKPTPAADEVLVRVHAASLNDWDYGAMLGGDLVNRLLFGLRRPKPTRQILGSDVAGRVEAVGRNVTRFQIGDEVFGDLSGTWGGFAEYVRARESALERKPSAMTFEQAAATPQAFLLALQALRHRAGIRAGQTLLINGGGGGVGTFGIQIARAQGLEVTAVDSAEKLDLMRSLGAHHVIDYEREDFTAGGKQYDRILDVKTSRSVLDCARALKPDGVYVTVGGSMPRLFQALLLLPWLRMTTRKKARLLALTANEGLMEIQELFETGKVLPVIDGPYGLRDVAAAFRRFGEGRHQGKVVITILQPDER